MSAFDWRVAAVTGGLMLLAGLARLWARAQADCWCCAWQAAPTD